MLRIAGAADTGSVYSDVSAAAHQENYWRDTNETYNRARLLFSVVPIKPVSDLRGPPGPRPQQVGKISGAPAPRDRNGYENGLLRELAALRS